MKKIRFIYTFCIFVLLAGCSSSDLENQIRDSSTYKSLKSFTCIDNISYEELQPKGGKRRIVMNIKFDSDDVIKLLEKEQNKLIKENPLIFDKFGGIKSLERLDPIGTFKRLKPEMQESVTFIINQYGRIDQAISKFSGPTYMLNGEEKKLYSLTGPSSQNGFINSLYIDIYKYSILNAFNHLCPVIHRALMEIMLNRFIVSSGYIINNIIETHINLEGVWFKYTTDTSFDKFTGEFAHNKLETFTFNVIPNLASEQLDVDIVRDETKKNKTYEEIDARIGPPYPIGFFFGRDIVMITDDNVFWGEHPDPSGDTFISTISQEEKYKLWLDKSK